jgi:hypothetical protein
MVPFGRFNASIQTYAALFTRRYKPAMPAVTHASAETFGLAMIVEIIVVERVVVSGLLRQVECGTGV